MSLQPRRSLSTKNVRDRIMQAIERANRGGKAGPAPDGGAAILVAAETAAILTLLGNEFQSRGFTVWLAADGDDAIELYREHQRTIGVVLLDLHLPGLDGLQCLRAIQQIDSAAVVCFTYGATESCSEVELRGWGVAAAFRKPFYPREIVDAVQRLASGGEPRSIGPSGVS